MKKLINVFSKSVTGFPLQMVSEGAETIKALYKIIKENNLKAPIFTALYEVIYGGKPVSELESTFMSRDLKSEFLN